MGTRDLEGKVAIVTGGTGGIGRGAALRIAERGATVIVNGRSADKGAAVVAEIEAAGGKATFIAGDVLSKAAMDALAGRVAREFGGIDIVVANAGGRDDDARAEGVRGLFRTVDLSRVATVVGNAMLAKLQPVQSALPFMEGRGGGSVVFVTSEGGRVPTPGQTSTSTFAGGLVMSSKVIAKELAKEKIRVNTVCVTVVRDTPSWDAMQRDGLMSDHHKKQYEKIAASAPLGLAGPEDIGSVIAFLASPESAYMTGATVSTTGGLTVS